MAFPLIRDESTGVQNTNVTAHPVVLPTSVSAGDLLRVTIAFDGNPTVTWDNSSHGTWTLLFDVPSGTACRLVSYAKVAAGTEGGGTLNITTSASEQSVYRASAVYEWFGTLATGVAVQTATGTSATPDPPNNAPGWGALDILWGAVTGYDQGNTTISGYPADYNDSQFNDRATGANGVCLGFASRSLNASSQNPGTFSISASRAWVAATVAIRPSNTITGSLSRTLGALTSSGAGALSIAGSVSRTLGAATSSSAAALAIAGSTGATLGAATLSSTASLLSAIEGSTDATLGAMSCSSAASLAIAGTSAQQLGALTASGAAELAIAGSTDATLGALTLSSVGDLAGAGITGTVSRTLGALTASAAAEVAIEGTATVSLGALTCGATGTVAGAEQIRVTQAYFELPASAERARVSQAYFELPASAERARVTQAYFELPEGVSAVAGRKEAGAAVRKLRRRYRVEIDGQEFVVSSVEEARQLLEQAEEIARLQAERATERAAKAPKRAKRKLLADARKQLQLPQIRVIGSDIDPVAAAIEQATREFVERIRSLYAQAMQAVEIGALLRRRLDYDEDEAITVLLITP